GGGSDAVDPGRDLCVLLAEEVVDGDSVEHVAARAVDRHGDVRRGDLVELVCDVGGLDERPADDVVDPDLGRLVVDVDHLESAAFTVLDGLAEDVTQVLALVHRRLLGEWWGSSTSGRARRAAAAGLRGLGSRRRSSSPTVG